MMRTSKYRGVPGETKFCSKCNIEKPLSDYYADNRKARKPGSVRSTCKECDKIQNRLWAQAHPEYVAYRQRYFRLRHYSMSVEQFDQLLEKQGRKCAICGTTKPGGAFKQWHVDHDHSCCDGKFSCGDCIRGILCSSCNLGLGHVQDNISRLKAMIKYLKSWREK